MTNGALVVKRWTRYGKDRLYVSTSDGEKVGFLDLLTGQTTVERTDLTVEFHEAVKGHQEGQESSPVTRTPTESVPAPIGPLQPPTNADSGAGMQWTDLALNRPGQGVRAEAESLLADMKANSRVGTFLKRAFDAQDRQAGVPGRR